MIGVSAASGHLGRSALQALSQRAPKDRLVAIVRNPQKAKDLAEAGFIVRQGDYNDPEGMRRALFGVEKFLLISSNALGERVQQHERAIAAAATAGVSLIAYTSLLHCDVAHNPIAREHKDTEAAIRACNIPYVILRNGWYLENFMGQLPAVLQSHTLLGAAARGRICAASRSDYAAAAAIVLTQPGHMNKSYELAGDEPFTLEALADAIAHRSGKPVRYRNLTEQEYAGALIEHHVPRDIAHMLAQSDAAIARGELEDNSHQLSNLLGRPTRSLTSLLEELMPGI